ncbi:Nucleotide-binding, alpha-beta plait [Lasallia pustulata]|uniref:Nucleotide-binding, alpha-beta plait n=1 Tax=Lasallia pustulata TaxID=136370 RepID=A0A1W5D556_9LECA|nr:Nucleotide-binding, alpha-beta plait [Lasallia pustulata]
MARGNRKATAIGSGIRRQAPSKSSNRRRNKATNDNAPRMGAPYFAHDALDPAIYPANIRQPVGGPSPNPTIIELEGDESDDAVLDVGSEADDESDNLAKTKKPSKSNRPPVRPLRDVKRIRVEGGRAPAPKRIQADLDSDDEVIVKMKAEKFTDKQIAARLREEGRVNYHYKTISSRWIRIKNALEKRRDQDLDDQLTDWHEGDDYVLLQAISAADREIYRLKQAVQERKWRLVSMQMRDIKPNTNYSKDACRSRFEALENDTATIPPELGDDPEQGAGQREEAKGKAAKTNARRRLEKAEGLENVRAANGASKKIHTALKETPASSSRVGTPGSARYSLPVNRIVDVSDDTSSLSDLDSEFGGSSIAFDDEILSASKPTGLLPVKGLTHDNSGSLVVQSQEISTRQGSPESSFSSGANIDKSDPESAQPHQKPTFVPTEHQASRRQSYSTQQEDTYSTGSEGGAVVQDRECFLKESVHEECTENLRSSCPTTKTRITTELLTVSTSVISQQRPLSVAKDKTSPSISDGLRTTNNHTNQYPSTVASPASSDTYRSGTFAISQQRPLSVVKDGTSPSTAAQLVVELRDRHLVEEATKDQTIKKVETKRAAAMENRPLTSRQLQAILKTKDFEDLLAASRRLSLNTDASKPILIFQLIDHYMYSYSGYDPIFTPSRLQAASQPDTRGQTRPDDSIRLEAADESLNDNAKKRTRRSAPITGEGVTVPGLAYTRGSEQISLSQRVEETPLPRIHPRLDTSKEHMEAKDESDKKRKRSLAGGVRKNSMEAGRGPGGPNSGRNPSRPLKHLRTILPKPAAGDPAAQAQLNPLDASLFYAANNPSMGEPRANVATMTDTTLFYAANNPSMGEPRANVPTMTDTTRFYAANNPTMTELGSRFSATSNMPPVYAANNPSMGEPGSPFPAMINMPPVYAANNPSIGEPGARFPAAINMSPVYAANNPSMGEPRARFPATISMGPPVYAANSTSMGEPRARFPAAINMSPVYAANNPSMGEPRARFPATISMGPPVYAANSTSMGEPRARFPAAINMSPVYGMGNLSMGEFGANDAAMTDTPRFYTTNNPAIDPAILDSPMPQFYERESPIVTESAAFNSTMVGTPSDEWGIDNLVVTGNVREFAPQPQQRGRQGGTGTLTGRREPTYHRVRVSGLPRDVREDELQAFFVPYNPAVIDRSQVRATRSATLFFDDRYTAQAAAFVGDGARLRTYYLTAKVVDLQGNEIPRH